MNKNEYNVTINQSKFHWEIDKGLFQFEGDDVVLFWIDTAFKTFLDSIEEVTGEDSARVVLETAGYRTGTIVSEFYRQRSDNPDDVLKQLPNIYKVAGWGATDVIDYSIQDKTALLHLHDDWEYKVNKQQGKTEPGSFLAGHWAGVFSGLFGTTMWYNIKKSQIAGAGLTEIELYESETTPNDNMREMMKSKERQAILRLEAMVEDRTRELNNLVKDLSSPMIPVLDHIVVVPLIGRFDESRSQELIEKTLQGIVFYKASVLIFDVTGMKEMDDYAVALLENVTQASMLVGCTPIIVGVSPDLSMQLTKKGVYLRNLQCFATLKHAVLYALSLEGLQVLPK